MKPTPDNRLAYGLRMVIAWMHLRHFRGHNVHSPFAYGLIRNVFVPRKLCGGDETIFVEALSAGLPRRAAIRLQNLRNHCPAYRLLVFGADEIPQPPDETALRETIRCIVHPRLTKKRFEACQKLIATHSGMSIDNRNFILLFDNPRLNKKHYTL